MRRGAAWDEAVVSGSASNPSKVLWVQRGALGVRLMK